MTKQIGTYVAGAIATLLIVVSSPAAVSAGTLDLLPGRWTGYGVIKLSNGSSERVKCVATYFLRQSGRALEHNLRCASTSFRIDAKAELWVRGNNLSGEWRERTYATGGAVSGRVVGKGLRLTIEGQNFAAALNVNTPSRCRQSISISPRRGLDIAGLSIGLGRAC